MKRQLGYHQLTNLAVAEGATTPDPGGSDAQGDGGEEHARGDARHDQRDVEIHLEDPVVAIDAVVRGAPGAGRTGEVIVPATAGAHALIDVALP